MCDKKTKDCTKDGRNFSIKELITNNFDYIKINEINQEYLILSIINNNLDEWYENKDNIDTIMTRIIDELRDYCDYDFSYNVIDCIDGNEDIIKLDII